VGRRGQAKKEGITGVLLVFYITCTPVYVSGDEKGLESGQAKRDCILSVKHTG
jgi:hypothetical protein